MQFQVRKSIRGKRIIHVVLISFVIFILWVLFLTDRSWGIALTAASILFFLLILVEIAKFGWYYRVDEEGVVIKRSLKSYLIPADSIKEVKEIAWKQAEKILSRVQAQESGVKGQIEFGRVIGYCSVPIPNPQKSKRAIPGEGKFVVLVKKNGKEYLLTPKDGKKFVRETRKIMNEQF